MLYGEEESSDSFSTGSGAGGLPQDNLLLLVEGKLMVGLDDLEIVPN